MAPSRSNIFLRLPPEIRYDIYRLLLKKDSPIRISTPRIQTWSMDLIYSTRTSGDSGVAVLWLCKCIQEEAITVFFESNTFQVEVGYPLKAFVNFIPKNKRAMIRKLEMKINFCRAFSPAAGGSGDAAFRPEPLLVHNRFSLVDFGDLEDSFRLISNSHHFARTPWAMFGNMQLGLFLGTATDIATFRSFYRSVASVFPGVEEFILCPGYGSYETDFIAPNVDLAFDTTAMALFEMFRLIKDGPDGRVRSIKMKDCASYSLVTGFLV